MPACQQGMIQPFLLASSPNLKAISQQNVKEKYLFAKCFVIEIIPVVLKY